jgi:hypothetical protein
VAGPLECRDTPEGTFAVHEQRPLAPVRGQLELLARDAGHLDDLDPPPRDRPERVVAADRFGAIRRVQLALERRRERDDPVGAFLDDEVAALEDDEGRAVTFQLGRVDGDDGIPLAHPMEAMNPARIPRRSRPRLFERNPALAREPDVKRLTAPEERHPPLWAVRRRGSSVRFSR